MALSPSTLVGCLLAGGAAGLLLRALPDPRVSRQAEAARDVQCLLMERPLERAAAVFELEYDSLERLPSLRANPDAWTRHDAVFLVAADIQLLGLRGFEGACTLQKDEAGRLSARCDC